MHVVVRNYQGQGHSELFEAMEQRVDDVKDVISGVPGFVSYAAFSHDDDVVVTVTICEDKAGTDESSKRAAAWIKENVSDASVDPPEITDGDTFIQF